MVMTPEQIKKKFNQWGSKWTHPQTQDKWFYIFCGWYEDKAALFVCTSLKWKSKDAFLKGIGHDEPFFRMLEPVRDTKKIEGFINIYGTNAGSMCIHPSRKMAKENQAWTRQRVACIPVSIEYYEGQGLEDE